MENAFQPISEAPLFLPPMESRIVVAENEKKSLSFGIEVAEGEKKEMYFAADVLAGSTLEVTISVHGGGIVILHRTVNVLGERATVSLKCSGIMELAGRILAGDDIRVSAENADIDVRTKIVLKGAAVSEARSRILLNDNAHGAKAFAQIHHLLLSDGAKGFSVPELDIRTDDVTCGHSSSSSSPSLSSMQYLAGRGLDKQAAINLLVHGFLTL